MRLIIIIVPAILLLAASARAEEEKGGCVVEHAAEVILAVYPGFNGYAGYGPEMVCPVRSLRAKYHLGATFALAPWPVAAGITVFNSLEWRVGRRTIVGLAVETGAMGGMVNLFKVGGGIVARRELPHHATVGLLVMVVAEWASGGEDLKPGWHLGPAAIFGPLATWH